MTFEEAAEWHEETKKYGSVLGLEKIRNLMHELEDVWKKLKIVHIAGTNGKGSVCCFLASALREAGYKTGQFNSPAVFDPREVYQIDGTWIGEDDYAECMSQVKAACGRMTARGQGHPTVFEIETAAAFLWFYREKCDIVLLEAGMGGSTDATNLIERPLLSVLTPVSMDHMEFLGGSLEEIAKVKSGIIKCGCPVVSAPQPIAVEKIFRNAARKKNASYRQAAVVSQSRTEICEPRGVTSEGGAERRFEEAGAPLLCYRHPSLGEVRLSMTGSYQAENSSLAIETLLLLCELGYSMTEEQILTGLLNARWPGRFECVCESPLFYIDGAHNKDAAIKLRETLTTHFPDRRKIGIMGVMADKAYGEMLDGLRGVFERIYTVTPEHPRALPAEALAEAARSRGIEGIAKESVEQAVRDACKDAAEEGKGAMAAAFGSLYYLREVKLALHEIRRNR